MALFQASQDGAWSVNTTHMTDIDALQFERMSPDEIDSVRVDKEKELKESEHAAALVKDEILSLSKSILEIRIKKNSLDSEYERARYNVKRIQSDIKVLTSKFWQSRNR
jgi:peptidoglycan hydrolase CwlO-like protein